MSDPDLTPTEEQVRRLLADARHDEPMPDDVAARLDGVLADLRDPSEPVDLAARRRRRTARTVLVAAAAVVVLGVGISKVDLSSHGQDTVTSDAGDSADAGSAAAPEASAPDNEAGGDVLLAKGRPLALSSEDFDGQVSRLQTGRGLSHLRLYDSERSLDKDLGTVAARGRGWCNDRAWGNGQRIPVRYDGRRGVLILRPPSGDARAADLYLCGESVPTRSTTVPAG